MPPASWTISYHHVRELSITSCTNDYVHSEDALTLGYMGFHYWSKRPNADPRSKGQSANGKHPPDQGVRENTLCALSWPRKRIISTSAPCFRPCRTQSWRTTLCLSHRGKSNQIRNILQTNVREGMQTLERSLSQLYQSGQVSLEDVRARSLYPDEIK